MTSVMQRLRVALRLPPPKSGVPQRHGMRRFEAAVVDRLTASWIAGNVAIDDELRRDLDKLRDRSRDLFKNNEYAKKFGRMVRNNVVGPEGFVLQARATDANGKLDTLANRAIEEAFWRWQRPDQCDVTGRRSFTDLCRAMVVAAARDGEFLLHEVLGEGEFGYQLQLVDIQRLDTKLNRGASPGVNAIRMGVEINSVGRPVAYHVWTSPPSLMLAAQERTRERWLAEHVIHGFMPLEEEDTRGVPWMHAAMRRLNDLGGYREAAIIAARVGAAKMGIYVSPNGEPASSDGTDSDGNFLTDATPGQFDVAPPGYDFKTYDPAYPHEQFGAFCKAALQGISGGFGVAYPGLANDLEGVNFSSIRAGVLEERDEWMVIQNWFITTVLVRIYERFIDTALMAGAVRLPNGSPLPANKKWKFLPHQWQGRRWSWVDPKKDIEAAVVAIENNLASPQMIAAQTGRDLEEVLDDLVVYRQMLADRGLPAPMASAPPPAAAPPDPDEPEDE